MITGDHHAHQVAIAILSYFLDHPRSKDNIAGIAKWWVGEDEKVVEKALMLLEAEGIIKKTGGVYQLSQHKSAPRRKSNGKKTSRKPRRQK